MSNVHLKILRKKTVIPNFMCLLLQKKGIIADLIYITIFLSLICHWRFPNLHLPSCFRERIKPKYKRQSTYSYFSLLHHLASVHIRIFLLCFFIGKHLSFPNFLLYDVVHLSSLLLLWVDCSSCVYPNWIFALFLIGAIGQTWVFLKFLLFFWAFLFWVMLHCSDLDEFQSSYPNYTYWGFLGFSKQKIANRTISNKHTNEWKRKKRDSH